LFSSDRQPFTAIAVFQLIHFKARPYFGICRQIGAASFVTVVLDTQTKDGNHGKCFSPLRLQLPSALQVDLA
jgi:hypothetical protein